MILVDTIYQRVLALANKEQRGYITPQEFNLFANQAQMEIFEQYFYDLNQVYRVVGNDTVHADVDDMLEEKLQVFERTDNSSVISNNAIYTSIGGGILLPNYIYRVSQVLFNNNSCEILNNKDFLTASNGGRLIQPTNKRLIANISGNIMSVMGDNGGLVIPSNIVYFVIPYKVNWAYVVMNKKAMYLPDKSTNFQLHPSEETELVYKILKFAGISMKREDIVKAGQGLEIMQVQQEKQ